MYSRRLATQFYLVVATCLFAFVLQTVSAAPAPEPVPEPAGAALTPGEVTSNNRNLACSAGSCYYTTQNGTAVENATDASAAPANSTDGTPEAPASNGALPFGDVRIALSVVVAGTSLLFTL